MVDNKIMPLASKTEEDMIVRKLMTWLNTSPDIPEDIYKNIIQYEQLPDDVPAMAVSSIQGTYITNRYISGGHKAEYQFKIIYRIKPGTSNTKRLDADELLDRIGTWAYASTHSIGGWSYKDFKIEKVTPVDLGENINVISIEPTTRPGVFAAYENGDEDHQILMKLTYEVI